MKLQIILILTVVLSGCTKWCETPVLLTKREHYLGNKVQLAGIYYSNDNAFYLYRNGVVKDACTNFSAQLPTKYSCGNSPELELASQKDRNQWGIYVVRQDTILVENWGMVNDCDYKTFFYTGFILNDTTILIQNWNNQDRIQRDTYKFALFPKRDSMNPFIP